MALPQDSHPAQQRTVPGGAGLALTLAVAASAALAGGVLIKLLSNFTPFYFPVVSGLIVGYAVRRVGPASRVIRGVIAAVFSFAGMVFGDALTFELLDHPGVWNYLTHFWLAASTGKAVLWLLNVAIGVWCATGPAPAAHRGFPIHTDQNLCRHCGQGNLPDSRFCAHCGEPMT